MIAPGWQRAIGVVALIPAGLAVPLTAGPLDRHVDENLLAPIAFGASATLGGITGAAMPAMFGQHTSRLGSAGIGAGIAVGTTTAVTAALLFGLGDR